MKTLVTTICLLFFVGIGTVNAQIKKPKIPITNGTTITKPLNLPPWALDNNLNLEKIKQHLKNRKMCYMTSLATNVIFPSGGGKVVRNMQGRFASSSIFHERDYLRLNTRLLRSDKRFNPSQADTYEVLIYPQRSKSHLVDKNRVKLTWRSPENGLNTSYLKNVSVQYKSYGILITGDYEINGKTMVGVSIAITPQGCII